MGLFTKKPYSTILLDNVLNTQEKAALVLALAIAADATSGDVKKKTKKAIKGLKKGALSKDDLAVVIACVEASLNLIKKADTSDMRTTKLMQKAEMEAHLATASEKLRKLLF